MIRVGSPTKYCEYSTTFNITLYFLTSYIMMTISTFIGNTVDRSRITLVINPRIPSWKAFWRVASDTILIIFWLHFQPFLIIFRQLTINSFKMKLDFLPLLFLVYFQVNQHKTLTLAFLLVIGSPSLERQKKLNRALSSLLKAFISFFIDIKSKKNLEEKDMQNWLHFSNHKIFLSIIIE